MKQIPKFSQYIKESTTKNILDKVKDLIWNANDLDQIFDAIKLQYGKTVPLFHASTEETAKIIDKEGLKPTEGGNRTHWGSQSNLYFQIGRSDYQAQNRPVLYRYDADISFLGQYAEADTDSISVSKEEVGSAINRDFEDDESFGSSEVKDFIMAFYNNDNKLEGLELIFIGGDDMPAIHPKRVK